MAKLMNSSGNIIDIFNLTKEDIKNHSIDDWEYFINKLLKGEYWIEISPDCFQEGYLNACVITFDCDEPYGKFIACSFSESTLEILLNKLIDFILTDSYVQNNLMQEYEERLGREIDYERDRKFLAWEIKQLSLENARETSRQTFLDREMSYLVA